MKKICIGILLISNIVFSQENLDKKIYLDSTFVETTSDNYKYFRIVESYFKTKDKYIVKDYYKSGIVQMTGVYIDNEGLIKDGEFSYFYENGNKKSNVMYAKNKVIGKYETWYIDGKPKEIGYHTVISEKEVKYTMTDFWDKNNNQTVINGNGNFEDEIEIEKAKGKFVNGQKDGTWTGYSKNFKIDYTESYVLGKLINGKSTDINGQTYNYDVVELKPEPKKGINDFYKFVGKKFIVPEIKGLTGKLILKFVIEKDGSISDITVVKSIGYGADEEGIRVLKKYSNWNPGKVRGINVRCTYQLPISIKSAY